MSEAVPIKAPPCAHCGGEGFLFSVQQGRASAAACECTRACLRCSGSGRTYVKDERGYELLRGCTCGADPRRLSLLTGLRLPLKFLGASLDGYRCYSPAQQRALLRARRFVDELVPGASGQRALLFCG